MIPIKRQLFLLIIFLRGLPSLKCLLIKPKKIFSYIDIREFARRRIKPGNISMPVFIKIFIYFLINIWIISSIVSPIIVTLISYIIVPIYVMFIGI